MRFATKRWVGVEFLPGQLAPAYETFNANLSYTSPDERFNVLAYVNNFTDEAVYNYSLPHTFVPALLGISVGPPRTYGVKLSYKFGAFE